MIAGADAGRDAAVGGEATCAGVLLVNAASRTTTADNSIAPLDRIENKGPMSTLLQAAQFSTCRSLIVWKQESEKRNIASSTAEARRAGLTGGSHSRSRLYTRHQAHDSLLRCLGPRQLTHQ